ncbi:MAG: hypothetical protein ACRCT6_01310 [Notoacmeibacter sp.]
MTEKHLGFAALRSSFSNREPQTMEKAIEPICCGVWPKGQQAETDVNIWKT